jgi:hypothetical protein
MGTKKEKVKYSWKTLRGGKLWYSIKQTKKDRAGDVAQWHSTRLTCARPWIQSAWQKRKTFR